MATLTRSKNGKGRRREKGPGAGSGPHTVDLSFPGVDTITRQKCTQVSLAMLRSREARAFDEMFACVQLAYDEEGVWSIQKPWLRGVLDFVRRQSVHAMHYENEARLLIAKMHSEHARIIAVRRVANALRHYARTLNVLAWAESQAWKQLNWSSKRSLLGDRKFRIKICEIPSNSLEIVDMNSGGPAFDLCDKHAK